MNAAIEYNTDFYSWLMQNAALLREGRFAEADAEHIAEELEAMGKKEQRELISRLAVLLAHLLKWTFQSVRRTRSWTNTIAAQRMELLDLLEDSPSLRHEMEEKIAKAYERSRLMAENETGIDKNVFPAECPFSLAQILDKDFYPESEN
jgi:predicted  nucleic acid-binding Zn-ribbon protein